jgi:flagellar motility protein MotE (MotC chaperone)
MNTRKLRLLPAVVIAGTALLGLKGFGLVHGAMAQTKEGTQIAANVPGDGIAAPRDIASDDNESSSASEADVLTSLAKRRAELDARARDQQMREAVLQATEKRVDAKIAALKLLQTQMTTLIGQRDAAQEKQVASLVKTYSSMKPKDAARIFDGLTDDVLVPVAQSMKSDALAPVLAAMNPQNAQKLTVKLASRLNLPDTTAAAAPPTPPSALPAPLPSIAPPAAATTPADASKAPAKAPGQQAQATPAAPPPAAAPQAPGGATPRG